MTPTREIYFNISHVWLMYALLAFALAVFGWGVYRRWHLWNHGRPSNRVELSWRRVRALLLQTVFHEKLLRRYRTAGVFHLIFFWSFAVLAVGTTVCFIHEDLGFRIMRGAFYLYFQSLALDIFGALFAVALLVAFYHRYGTRPARLKPDGFQDGLILALLLTIVLTGFLVEGARIQLTADPWSSWSPVGNASGKLLAGLFLRPDLKMVHQSLWWFHLVIVLGFVAWIPYSKLFHLFTAPASILFQDLGAKGALPALDFGETETLGVSRIDHLTWKDLLDLDACTECGRCEVNCPAFVTAKPLSPKKLILDMRGVLDGRLTGLDGAGTKSLVGDVIHTETLWSCTTCRACMEQCPVMIEHVPKIVGMRRHLVMEQSDFPGDLQAAVRSLEARGHPYPGVSTSRGDWHKDMDVAVLGERDNIEFDVLLWVGCSGALNNRTQSVTRAVAMLLEKAGVKFAILSRQERCTGDPARRIGHELLFQTLAQQNIGTFSQYGVKKILTACPHCFNTFRNEYPQLGGNYEVLHHSEFLQELVANGRLKLDDSSVRKVVFHDPCYLGRYNQVYDAPRAVLDAAPGVTRVEVEGWNRRNAMCCGGGGGFSFMEEKLGSRMNQNRSRQLLATGATTIAVGCPFCMTMIEDGVKTAGVTGQSVGVLDIAEVLARATGGLSV